MDKAQALNKFWNSFDIPAYEQNSIPEGVNLPYITYETATSSLGDSIGLNASIWYRSDSWEEISKKAEEIAKYLYEVHPVSQAIDGGRMYIAKSEPFAQRMTDDNDDKIKRILLSISVEYFTAY